MAKKKKKKAGLVEIEDHMGSTHTVGKESLASLNQDLGFLSSLQHLVRMAFSDISIKNAEGTLEV